LPSEPRILLHPHIQVFVELGVINILLFSQVSSNVC
jgi:hypothetical protein